MKGLRSRTSLGTGAGQVRRAGCCEFIHKVCHFNPGYDRNYQPDPVDWIDVLASVARAAGSVALKHYRKVLTVETRADGSPVTVADRAAEQIAVDWITERFPADCIVAEESVQYRPPNAERRWVIDPIDGTESFVHGVPLWGTMVGVLTGDNIIAGVVFCPAVDEMVVAAESAGCWYNGSRCTVSEVSDLAGATILGTSNRFAGKPERLRH